MEMDIGSLTIRQAKEDLPLQSQLNEGNAKAVGLLGEAIKLVCASFIHHGDRAHDLNIVMKEGDRLGKLSESGIPEELEEYRALIDACGNEGLRKVATSSFKSAYTFKKYGD